MATAWRGTDEGGQLKDTNRWLWTQPNEGATNETGFSALPTGQRWSSNGLYSGLGTHAYYWTATEGGPMAAYFRLLMSSWAHVNRQNGAKNFGLAVRCVKD